MDFIDIYLAKHGFKPEIEEAPHPALHVCIVIPCFNEPSLVSSLQSIWGCHKPENAVEVLVVINSPAGCSQEILEQNEATFKEADLWITNHYDPKLRFFLLYKPNLPSKFAGVGLARKIGMDEAVYRLNLINNNFGIITSFDADAVCASNYLVEVENHFKRYPKALGTSIYFEHPIDGLLFDKEIYDGVSLYELHLRYVNQALRYARHPHAFHTVGSSFAVRVDAYVKQGGMNKRQAGEDFYFLQKIIALGKFSEINTTLIIPSPRESDRVPFGTGTSITRWKEEGMLKTYNLKAFGALKSFIEKVDAFFESKRSDVPQMITSLEPSLNVFLSLNDFENELRSIIANCASLPTFRIRFFRWFNAFRVIKYLNFAHEKYYQRREVTEEAIKLLQKLGCHFTEKEPDKLLKFYRELDKSGFGTISL